MRKQNRYKNTSSASSNAPLLNDESSITSAGIGSSYVAPNHQPPVSASEPSSGPKPPSLYDPMAMLELSSALCQGYITLLSAGKASEHPQTAGGLNESTYSNVELAFAAVVDGNVIDACFGVRVSSKKNSSTEKRIKDVKEMLDELVNNCNDDENIEELVVLTYLKAFQIISQMHSKLKRLNPIAKCFCTKRVGNRALQNLKQSFHPLQQKILKYQSIHSQRRH